MLCSTLKHKATNHVQGADHSVNWRGSVIQKEELRVQSYWLYRCSLEYHITFLLPCGRSQTVVMATKGGLPGKAPDKDALRKRNGSEYPQASWTLQVGSGPALQRHSSACWAPWS